MEQGRRPAGRSDTGAGCDTIDRTLEAFELHDGQWLLIASAKDDEPVSIRPFDAVTFTGACALNLEDPRSGDVADWHQSGWRGTDAENGTATNAADLDIEEALAVWGKWGLHRCFPLYLVGAHTR